MHFPFRKMKKRIALVSLENDHPTKCYLNFMLATDSSAFLLFAFMDGLHFILGADSDDC